MDKIEIQVLGVSGGAAHVYQGLCSSSFLVLRNNQPLCLVDLGLGVTRALKDQQFDIPEQIIITHNHTDHAGELPVVLRVEEAKGRKLQVFAAKPVAKRLQQHRMAEHSDLISPDELAHWVSPVPEERMDLTLDLSIAFYPAKHSECCFGFVIYQGDTPLIGYTGDSGLSSELYDHISQCKLAIFDAREKGNQWHASLEEVKPFMSGNSFIIGHGQTDVDPDTQGHLLYPGQRLSIEGP